MLKLVYAIAGDKVHSMTKSHLGGVDKVRLW